jgi:hypothetical protein
VATVPPLTEVVAEGAWGTVEYAVRPSGSVPAKDFFDALDEKAQASFAVLFQNMANVGRLSSKRFKKEMGNLYTFKHEVGKRQIRFPCFRDGNRWILTHGFFKPGAKKGLGAWPKPEVDRAKAIEAEYKGRKP